MFNKIRDKIQTYIYNLIKQHDVDLINTSLVSHKANVGSDFKFGEYFTLNLMGTPSHLNIGSEVTFRRYCSILIHENAGLSIGKGAFFNNYCSINCLGSIDIGEDTLFGEGVKIYDHNHLHTKTGDQVTIKKNEFKTGFVKIGKNCWIGSNVTILNNVEIGDNVIIGANCLIYKSVYSNTIVKAKTEYII